MKIYFARGFTHQNGVFIDEFPGLKCLESFYDVRQVERTFEKVEKSPRIFIDSGAYSAWRQKIDIDIDKYISYCKERDDNIEVIANLDVIPGEFGRVPSRDEVESSAQQGWDNYQYMLSKGTDTDKLIHIFHQGESIKWLKKVVDAAGYIGISPANDRTTSQKIEWLDSIMPHLTDKKGNPIVKFHGFGVTAIKLLLRYPWYSADSLSWAMQAAMGGVSVPVWDVKKKEFCYTTSPWNVPISDGSPKLKNKFMHYTTLPLSQREHIDQYFKMKDVTFEALKGHHIPRKRLNIHYYLGFENNYVFKPINWTRKKQLI